MFNQLIVLGQLLISGLSLPSLQPNTKKTIGKKLSGLHYDLTLIYENGVNVLNIFTNHNLGKDVSIDEIKSLLIEQHLLIPRLLQFFEKKEIKTLFSIKAPEIKPIQFLLSAKGTRVRFYLDEIEEKERRLSNGDRIEWLSRRAIVEIPEQKQIDKSMEKLEEIKKLTEELRQFIIKNFEVNEII